MNSSKSKTAYVATADQVVTIDQLLTQWARAAAGGVVSHEAIRDRIIATCVSFTAKADDSVGAARLSSQAA